MLRSFVSHRALIAATLAAGLALPAVAHDTEADAPRKKEYFQPGANHAGTPAATGGSVPRYSGLGGIAMAVTTASPEAQAYFDQGLRARLGLQPRRGAPLVPGRAGARSELRHVLLGRGLRAGAEHQRCDGRGRPSLPAFAAISRARQLAGAGHRKGGGADRGARRSATARPDGRARCARPGLGRGDREVAAAYP